MSGKTSRGGAGIDGGGSVVDSGLGRICLEPCREGRYPRLARAGQSIVWRILDQRQIKSHEISHHLERLERSDPAFYRRRQEVSMGIRMLRSTRREPFMMRARTRSALRSCVQASRGPAARRCVRSICRGQRFVSRAASGETPEPDGHPFSLGGCECFGHQSVSKSFTYVSRVKKKWQ